MPPTETKKDGVLDQQFEETLGQLDTLCKSLENPTALISKGLDTSKPEGGKTPAEGTIEGDLAKALTPGEGGVIDGEALIKAVIGSVQKSVGLAVDAMNTQVNESHVLTQKALGVMAKSFLATMQQVKTIAEEVAEIGKQPQLRKSLLNVHERGGDNGVQPEGGKHAEDPCTRSEFMGKSINAGLSGSEVGEIGHYLKFGLDKPIKEVVPAHLYQRVIKP